MIIENVGLFLQYGIAFFFQNENIIILFIKYINFYLDKYFIYVIFFTIQKIIVAK